MNKKVGDLRIEDPLWKPTIEMIHEHRVELVKSGKSEVLVMIRDSVTRYTGAYIGKYVESDLYGKLYVKKEDAEHARRMMIHNRAKNLKKKMNISTKEYLDFIDKYYLNDEN